MKIGYNEACAKACSTLEQDLQLCERYGFDFIEMRLDMLKPWLETHALQELVDFFHTHRLKPHAINALYLYSQLFSEQDDPIRQQAFMADFALSCQIAQATGGGHIIIVPPLQPDPQGGAWTGKWEDDYQDCVRILKILAAQAASYDVKLCFELVGFNRSSVRSVAQANAIVTAVDCENLGFVFDAYNLYLYSGHAAFADIGLVRGDKIFAIHINNADDVPLASQGQDKRRFCDDGVMALGEFLRQVKATGYTGMVSVETFRPEYWQQTPEWVIAQAWKTTHRCLDAHQCL